MKILNNQHVQPFEFLQQLISNGGPEVHEYAAFNRVVTLLSEEIKAGNLAPVDIQLLQNGFPEECLSTTLHGHSLTKPYGYAGDFMIIDKIYREQVTADKRFEKWGLLWHAKTGKGESNANFNTINPSRNVMELFGDWHLEHRSEQHLRELALQAGAKKEDIFVGKEAEEVNLFLHVKM
jgi:hypothetical protein